MAPEPTVLDRLLEISELFQRDLAREFDGTSLTTARTRVLWELAHSGPSTQQALAGRLDVSPRNITGLVDALEETGYVERAPHPADRRAVLVTLTPSAAELMREMQRDHEELGATLLAAVAPDDRDALVRGIEAITARLRDLVAAAEAGRATGGTGGPR
ncbi:MarR family winged helix-turn-helix transcriptional regulator [Agromyces aurantiacus]|uniref:MarR family winged helix-turn-helix transcriptional regulator n=1 Tax=Agromyces aurantiacus TaxID=165814 RepID=A0ABV9RBC9_9MICO|nr:MarR family transcriptional regulator [Agromyces aurantiacus]MBM7504542.1 DNA-binding MarR family transcriptional regulator [Agromyces aurantiacus]